MTARPLANITVIEMGTFITGPAAGMMLADLGAEVIKVEQPGAGDPFRSFKGGLYSPHFQTYNRNKQSIALDPKNPDDLEVLDGLVKQADVFIENFRPGVTERLNVHAERLRELNPRLIYASISGFGSEGPDRDRPAFDTVAQAASGFLRLLVNPGHPRVVGPAIADAMTGFYTALGILAALNERHETGKGRLVECSMFEAMCHFNLDDFTHLLSVDEVMGPWSRPHVSQSYVFECADGKWLALHMSSPPKFWENLAATVGRPDMLEMEQFATREARIAHYDDVIAFLAPIFATKDRDYWTDELTRREVPNSPVRTSEEVLASAQAKALGIQVDDPDGPMGPFSTVRNPLSFDGERMTEVAAPPVLDQQGEQLRKRAKG
ncbi:CoA transferase [Aurantiacibacter sp. MUD11]|uniref:CaiB/BaiF CoA transferase family protein n=1 Tax=Aurantiacibacter sp. MUD11 TaxID=3003265 RepID=UPI0022AB0C1C|nr:CoA transferase [Aurantiacibacter sp. MUD11]WAT18306.1 CoA transferase [Aurantiacibacter sp. MUD11]